MFASRPDDEERLSLGCHFILQIMRRITTNFCDSHTAPVPQELVSVNIHVGFMNAVL